MLFQDKILLIDMCLPDDAPSPSLPSRGTFTMAGGISDLESIRLITPLSGHAVFYLDITGDNLSDWLDIMRACLYLSGTIIVTAEVQSSMVHGPRSPDEN